MKPSERIKQIAINKHLSVLEDYRPSPIERAIMEFLDEQVKAKS